jgi:oligopeptide/dipeptide ABC transporter ATP-binding protein
MLVVRDVVKEYASRATGRRFAALRGVSLALGHGETLGIVGESGCGKSTLARLLVGLEVPTSGTIEIDDQPLADLRADRRKLARRIQMVFQDPHSALNPRRSVRNALGEVLQVHGLTGDRQARALRVNELLDMVGLSPRLGERFPHELSGGQKQRVGIARALAVEPAILVLDEPVSALDVSVRAQVMNLLIDLRQGLGLSYVFISHDLGMVRQISDRVGVMYLGRFVEEGDWRSVLDAPAHPYTRALADAVPTPNPAVEAGKLADVVSGEVPDPAAPPSGCAFHPRCPDVIGVCSVVTPDLETVAVERRVACHVAVSAAAAPGRATNTA